MTGFSFPALPRVCVTLLARSGALVAATCLLLAGSVQAEEVESVYSVNVNGQVHQLVELLRVKRDRLPKWNAFLFRRGAQYHEYRVLDSEWPVRFYEHEFQKIKKLVKDVPDNRTFDQKHPYVQPTISGVNNVLTILGWFIR